MQKLLLKRHRAPQRRVLLLYPQKPNRKLQASIDLARSKHLLHSPLPVKGLPPNPKGSTEFQHVQKSHINSFGTDTDPHNTMV